MAIKYTKREFNNNLKEPAIDKEFLNDFQDYVISIDEEGGSGSTSASASVETRVARVVLPKGTIITNNYQITLPISYIVGNNSLRLYWNGEKLIKASDTEDGHYKEVGTAGTASNAIKMHRTTADGTYKLIEDAILEVVVYSMTEEKYDTGWIELDNYLKYRKVGNKVIVHFNKVFNGENWVGGFWNSYATIPKGFRPLENNEKVVYAVAVGGAITSEISVAITTDGVVSFTNHSSSDINVYSIQTQVEYFVDEIGGDQ